MQKKYFEYLKSICRIGFFIFFALSFYSLGVAYGKFSQPGQDLYNFMTTKQEYKYNVISGLPATLKAQVDAFNKIHDNIQYAVIFSFLVMIFDYFVDKENHFITQIKNKFKGVDNEI